MTRRCTAIVVGALWLVGRGIQAQQSPAAQNALAAPVTLGSLEAQALATHPAIREASARVDEARGRAQQAGAWFNPTVGVALDELRPRESPSGFIGGVFQQTIPLGGKLAAATTEAQHDLRRREAELATVKLGVLATLRTRFYELLAAQERVRVTGLLSTLSNEAVDITRQLFNVGSADQPDVLAAEVEARRAAIDLTTARTAAETSWALLATAAGQSALPRGPLAPAIDAALPVLDRQQSLDQVLRESPELQAALRSLDRERSSVDVARRSIRPDLFLRAEAGWIREHNVDPPIRAIGPQFGIEAGVSLPLFNRNRGGIAAAVAAVTASDAAVADLRLSLAARFAMQFGDYESGRAAVQAYREDILPRAQQAYELYLAKYRQMAAAYPQVLVTQRNLFDLTREYIDALDHTWRASLQIQGLLVGSRMADSRGGSR